MTIETLHEILSRAGIGHYEWKTLHNKVSL